ncbi:ribonuclease HII [Methylophilus sp. UBA6697]|jgi:ribonuclease HII|uniref:ribonuclease HII n=1 Tax=Methylophilus sp. UBA6697 TaxID=1946902 RepID=UPI000EE211B4|nr:ribonuclease HII [Methylophilus sp. UBA6697]HCU85678.1 ribonuclease HII [Methylophilus sp.]
MLMQRLCGIDEAGRGPLAGAVYAAAVILNPERPIAGLADSKKLSEAKRDALAIEIKAHALAWGIASVSAQEIDEINILQASLLAMQRAYQAMVAQFGVHATLIQVDGNRSPKFELPCEAIVKGDSKVAEISAASILAKTARDASLLVLDAQYPQYGFAQHKGYPTALHLARLAQHGITPEHRRSYGPVKKLLA